MYKYHVLEDGGDSVKKPFSSLDEIENELNWLCSQESYGLQFSVTPPIDDVECFLTMAALPLFIYSPNYYTLKQRDNGDCSIIFQIKREDEFKCLLKKN